MYFILSFFSVEYCLVPEVRKPANEIIKAQMGEPLPVTYFLEVFCSLTCLLRRLTSALCQKCSPLIHFNSFESTLMAQQDFSKKRSHLQKSLTWLSVCCNTMQCHPIMHYALCQLSTSKWQIEGGRILCNMNCGILLFTSLSPNQRIKLL